MTEPAKGLYRKGDWAFVAHGNGERVAMTRADYEAAALPPAFETLTTEDDFNEHALGRKFGDTD